LDELLTEVVELHFRYDEDDFVPAVRTYLMRKPKFIALFFFIYFLLIGWLKFLFSGGIQFDATGFIMCSIGSLLGLGGLLLYVFPHQRFQHSYRAVDEHWFHFDEQGISYETEYESGILTWRRCTKLLERKRFYLFEHDHRRITVIPKRAFKNDKEETAFRAILKTRLTPALRSKLLKRQEPKPGEDYVPPDEPPNWR
jgi:hypothetical protein